MQQNQITALLREAGFAYERDGDYFYSIRDCWQRGCGYCRLYDELAPAFGMILDAEPVEFSHGGKRWLIELWKGQYGIATGAEIGLYHTDSEEVKPPRLTGVFYKAVPGDEMMEMTFALKKHGRVILRRGGRHFWLTGFLLGEFSEPRSLTLDAKITFPSGDMAEAFTGALEKLGYTKREYSRKDAAVSVRFRTPHGKRNFLEKARDQAVQLVNYGNCRLYRAVTAPCADTMDALEHLYHLAPRLFDFMLRALYPHAFFASLKWPWENIEPASSGPLGPPEPPIILPEPPIGLPEPLIDLPEPPLIPSESSEPPERLPLMISVPVFVPRHTYQLPSPAPIPRPPEPSCLSELKPPNPNPHPARPNRNAQNRGGRQRNGRR